jgi:hypothetical protein
MLGVTLQFDNHRHWRKGKVRASCSTPWRSCARRSLSSPTSENVVRLRNFSYLTKGSGLWGEAGVRLDGSARPSLTLADLFCGKESMSRLRRYGLEPSLRFKVFSNLHPCFGIRRRFLTAPCSMLITSIRSVPNSMTSPSCGSRRSRSMTSPAIVL